MLYKMMVTFFTDYRQLPMWTHRLMSIRFVKRNNPPEVYTVGPSPDLLATNFLFDRALQFPQVGVQKLVQLVETSARIDGQCTRYLELVTSCDAVAAASLET